MKHPADIEADGFTTCHPPLTGQAPAGTALDHARAVLADLAHHADTDVIAAARTVAHRSPDPDDRRSARQLLEIMLQPAGSGGDHV